MRDVVHLDQHGFLRIDGPMSSQAVVFADVKHGPAIQWRTDGPMHLVRLSKGDIEALISYLRELGES